MCKSYITDILNNPIPPYFGIYSSIAYANLAGFDLFVWQQDQGNQLWLKEASNINSDPNQARHIIYNGRNHFDGLHLKSRRNIVYEQGGPSFIQRM